MRRAAFTRGLLAWVLLSACGNGNPSAGADVLPKQKDVGLWDVGPGADGGIPEDAGRADVYVPPPVDTDEDGIPDFEDPEPNNKNTRLFSDLFDELLADWIFTSTQMHVDDTTGFMTIGSVEPYIREAWLGPRPTWGDIHVRTRLRYGQVGSGATSGSGRFGIIARVLQVAPKRYMFCGYDGATKHLLVTQHDGNGQVGGSIIDREAVDIAPGEWFDLSFTAEGDIYTCRIGDVAAVGRSSVFIAGSVGFRALEASFDAEYLEVYEN